MNRPALRPLHFSRGLTLVELMIAIVLSLILLGGTIAIFVSSKQAYRTQEDLARIQENLRYGITQIINEASGAGFMGCAASAYAANTQVTSTVAGTDFSSLVRGEEGTGANGTDKLTLNFAQPGTGVPVSGPMQKKLKADGTYTTEQEGDVVVDPNHPNYVGLQSNDVVAVSDCDAIAVFKITNSPGATGALVHDATGNTQLGIQHRFGDERRATATVYKVDGITFEVEKTSASGSALSSLYATRFNGAKQLILAGVEDFQVTYGIDVSPRDGSADRYLRWDQVTAAQRNDITSLHIRITVNPGLPVVGSTGIHPRFKKTSEFTVKLRNRNGDA